MDDQDPENPKQFGEQDAHPPYPEQDTKSSETFANNIFLAGTSVALAAEKALDASLPFAQRGTEYARQSGQYVQELADAAQEKAKPIVDQGKNVIQNTSGELIDYTQEQLEKAKPVIDQGKTSIKNGMDYTQEKLDQGKTSIKNKSGELIEYTQEQLEKAKPMIDQGKTSIKNGMDYTQEKLERAKPIIEQGKKQIKDKSGEVFEFTQEHIEKGKTFVKDRGFPLSQSPVTPGCVIQLISASAGGAVQIVMQDGHMALDARGALDVGAFNTLWAVVPGTQADRVALHNHRNFLSVTAGQSGVTHVPQGDPAPPQTDVIVRQRAILAAVEFAEDPGSFLGFCGRGLPTLPAQAAQEYSHCLAVRIVAV